MRDHLPGAHGALGLAAPRLVAGRRRVRHRLPALHAVRHAVQHRGAGVPRPLPARRRHRGDPRRRSAAAVPVRHRTPRDHRVHHHRAPAVPDARPAPQGAGRREQPARADGVRLAAQPGPTGRGDRPAGPRGLPGVRADRGRQHRHAHPGRHRRRPGRPARLDRASAPAGGDQRTRRGRARARPQPRRRDLRALPVPDEGLLGRHAGDARRPAGRLDPHPGPRPCGRRGLPLSGRAHPRRHPGQRDGGLCGADRKGARRAIPTSSTRT